MKTKRILALFLAVVTCLSLAVSASAASISDFKDVDTKAWYAEAVTAAVDNGLLYGKSKTQLDPNGLLTRAEMAAITNRSFGCYKAADISAYKDVAKGKWYYKDVALAVQMGTYNGVSSTSMQPDRAITRQEAIAVVARALQLDLDDYAKTDLSKFADAKEVSGWALPYMKAMVAAGYVHGRTQGLVPQANITRAEFAQLYFNIIQSYITKSGSYTKDYKGNLLVRTKDVELKDMSIDGDLIIGNGVADGKVTLSNVKISGRLVVWGGGTAAIYCNDGTTAGEVIACRVDGPVKVIFDRESTLLVYDKIKTRITERAGKFPETEIVFYAMDDLLNAQRDLLHLVRGRGFEQVVENTRNAVEQRPLTLQRHDGVAEGRFLGVIDDRLDLGARAGDGRIERRLVIRKLDLRERRRLVGRVPLRQQGVGGIQFGQLRFGNRIVGAACRHS